MKRPQDAIPGTFHSPGEWLTDPKAVETAIQDVLDSDHRSAPTRRLAMQLVDHFTVHELPLPPSLLPVLAKTLRVTRVALMHDRQQALARGEDVKVQDRSKRRLRNRPDPDDGTLPGLWVQIEQQAKSGATLPVDIWWAVAQRLKVSPPRRRPRLVGVRKTGETDGEFVWEDKPPQKRHGQRYRDKDRQRAINIEAQARLVRGRHDVKALPYPLVAKLANVLNECNGPATEVVKAWGASEAWRLTTSAIAMHPISNGIEQEAAALMRGHRLTAEELAAWIRVEPAVIKAWRREISAVEVASLIDGKVREGDPLVKVVQRWWKKDEPWGQRVGKRHEYLTEARSKHNSHRKARGHELHRTRKSEI